MDQTKEKILELYNEVFKIARHFLKQTDSHDIFTLNQHNNPTYEKIAQSAEFLAALMEAIAMDGGFNEVRISLNAKQAALFMKSLALAITEEDQEKLDEAKNQLANLNFI